MKKYYGHPRFYELLKEIAQLHAHKNFDYSSEDPLSNFLLSEKMGIPAWKGCLVRMSDKISRLWSFAKREKYLVKDESVIDTAKDLAVYSLLMIILYEESKKKEVKNENSN